MFDGKFYATPSTVSLLLMRFSNMNSNKNQVSENFLPQMTYKVDREVAMSKQMRQKVNFLSSECLQSNLKIIQISSFIEVPEHIKRIKP